MTTEYAFWLSVLLIAYAYVLYPLLLFCAYTMAQISSDCRYINNRRNRRSSSLAQAELPMVTVVIPAHNEQAYLAAKLDNLRNLDYPGDRLEFLFVSDGSTDATNDILNGVDAPNVHTLYLPRRMGKSVAVNEAFQRASGSVVILSDATTMFAPDAVSKLVRHFVDPGVGVVCGSLRFEGTIESERTEGVYWRYESMLRLMEARLGATLTASGAIYAVRKECKEPLAPDALIDDFVVPMTARKQGYSVLYDPEAIATDFASASVTGEFRRRVRIAMGSFNNLLRFVRTPLSGFTALAFFSHKLLRWTVPFLLVVAFVSNSLIFHKPGYAPLFIGQCLFYVWALAGFLFHEHLQGVRFVLLPYFLFSMNLAFLLGFVRVLFGRTEATWEHAR